MNGNYLTRQPRYADVVRTQYPYARKRYFDDLEYEQDERAMAQQAAQFDEMAELERQQMEFERQQMEDAMSQANYTNILAGANLAKEAVPRLYSGGRDLYRYAMGSADKGEQAINNVFAPQYQSPDMQNLTNEFPVAGEGEAEIPSGSEYIGGGEVALAPGYDAGVAAVNNLYTPAYTSPAVEAIAAEGAASVAPGVGEAAIPAVSGGQAIGEVGATAGSTAAEGPSLVSGLGTAALMYAPYGLFKAFQKNKPSLQDYWPLMTHEQKLELIKTDPEYVARSGVVPGLGLYRESGVRNLGSGLGTPDAADRPEFGYRSLGAFGESDGAYRTSSVSPMERNNMLFQRNYNLGNVRDVSGESFDLGGKTLSFNTSKDNSKSAADYFLDGF